MAEREATFSVKSCVSIRVPLKSFAKPVAVIVKVDFPVAVGVPEIVPSLESESPAGSVPALTDQIVFDGIPLVWNENEYGEPTDAAFTDVVAIEYRLGPDCVVLDPHRVGQ